MNYCTHSSSQLFILLDKLKMIILLHNCVDDTHKSHSVTLFLLDMPDCVEKKHTSPINEVSALSDFDREKVDPELVCKENWNCKDNDGPKVLVCHDMEGGYRDDKFVGGTDNPDFYNFYHWAQIDIFVYFSHHLVTIPPLMWIETAHKNGVKVLGTFITEWDHGANNCLTMFGSVQSSIHFAKKLADIALTYNFDGWLINIENVLTVDGVENIQVFLQYLTQEMKESNPLSSIIWYDAVTNEGKLEWQDSVTDLNSCFFRCCDGIFLNYTWKDWKLELTLELCIDKPLDVFVGIDVFARGCIGKFECHISTEKIIDYGFSVALFATAWCYEQTKPDFPSFIKHNNRFWNLLQPTCSPKPLTLTQDEKYVTEFNFGFGKKAYRYGFLLSLKSWFNLSKQDVPFINFINDDKLSTSINDVQAFESSTCLQVDFLEGTSYDNLICLDMSRRKGGEMILVCKSLNDSQMKDLKMLVTEKNGIQHSLHQEQNMFIGGNHWRRITFPLNDALNIKWIGLKFEKKRQIILLGQLSC